MAPLYKLIALSVFFFFLLVSPILAQSPGVTWYVDGSVPSSGDGTTPETAVQTIGEGLEKAEFNDTVVVASGAYSVAVSAESDTGFEVPDGVKLIGADPANTIIDGRNRVRAVVKLGYQSVLEGFTIVGSCGYWGDCQGVKVISGGAAVRNNRITANSAGVNLSCPFVPGRCGEPAMVEFNQVYDNSGIGVINTPSAVNTIMRNNTFVGNYAGLSAGGHGSLIQNNLVISNTHYGIGCSYGSTDEVSHNGFWDNNGADTISCTVGEGNLFQDPFIRSLPGNDYRLSAGSPMRGRGFPAGTDIGAIPFVGEGSSPTNMTATLLPDRRWQLQWSAIDGANYHVFLGDESGLYTERYEVAGATTLNIEANDPSESNYLAVSAIDPAGHESPLSSEVKKTYPALTNATVEQDSIFVWPDSNWQTVSLSQASGGAYLSSAMLSAQIQLIFEGDSLVLGRRLGPNGGYATVYLDGTRRGWLDYYHPFEKWQIPAVLDGLGAGKHVLELVVAGKQTAASGYEINLDTMTAPNAYAPSSAQIRAIDHINYYRTIVGLPLARGVQAIHMAAQAHAEFYALNRNDPRLAGLGFHTEHADLPGFTGQGPSDRAAYFGYTGGVGEDGHFLGDPILSVDGWMATVYHRNLLMCYGCVDAGYGLVKEGNNKVDALSMGAWTTQRLGERTLFTYPADNQLNVPRSWNGAEIPDPLPGHPRPVGYPLSLYIVQPLASVTGASPSGSDLSKDAVNSSLGIRDATTRQPSSPSWAVTTAELKKSTGVPVPVIMLDQDTDIPQYLGPDVVFLIPEQPLLENTTYAAHIAGVDSQGRAFDHRWAFSTGATLAAPDLSTSQFWATPMLPGPGDTIIYQAQLLNTGLLAHDLLAEIALPAGTSYLPGSATISQGTVSGTGPLTFQIGDLEQNRVVTLRFGVTVPVEMTEPTSLISTLELSWDMGRTTRNAVSIANGVPVYLPVVHR